MPSASPIAAAPPVAFQINATDNVATLLEPAQAGPVLVRGVTGEKEIAAAEPIAAGHKIAIAVIEEGRHIVKFGVIIGVASRTIAQGEWVHLHNCHSRLDERSNAFDVRTGVPEDIRYE